MSLVLRCLRKCYPSYLPLLFHRMFFLSCSQPPLKYCFLLSLIFILKTFSHYFISLTNFILPLSFPSSFLPLGSLFSLLVSFTCLLSLCSSPFPSLPLLPSSPLFILLSFSSHPLSVLSVFGYPAFSSPVFYLYSSPFFMTVFINTH